MFSIVTVTADTVPIFWYRLCATARTFTDPEIGTEAVPVCDGTPSKNCEILPWPGDAALEHIRVQSSRATKVRSTVEWVGERRRVS